MILNQIKKPFRFLERLFFVYTWLFNSQALVQADGKPQCTRTKFDKIPTLVNRFIKRRLINKVISRSVKNN
jgi:hypothetical protein